jgi:GNAT superfamily N-acetyltransferase
VTVRIASEGDLDDMSILWRMMLKECRPGLSMNKEWWMKSQAGLMKTDIYCSYVAVCDSVIVGFIVGLLYPDAATGKMIAFGQEFYVVPEYRSSSIARRLYGKLVRKGKEVGAHMIEMSCFEGQLEMWQGKGYNIHTYQIRRAI